MLSRRILENHILFLKNPGKPYTFLEKSWKTIYFSLLISWKTMPFSQNFLERVLPKFLWTPCIRSRLTGYLLQKSTISKHLIIEFHYTLRLAAKE